MSPPATRPRPNVLFVIADDHRQDALGAYGHPVVRTPALDALAARGTRFTRAYHMGGHIAAVCSPARSCVLTGRHAVAANAAPEASSDPGCIVRITPGLATLPQIFRQAGYETFVTGKWHNDPASLHRSFTSGRRIFVGGMSDHNRVPLRDFSPTGDYSVAPHFEPGFSTELFCDAAIDFIGDRKDNSPFFLYLALTSPHDPRTPPPEFAKEYDPAQLPLPPSFLPEHPFDNGEMLIRDETLAPKPLTPAVIRRHLADYYGMIAHQDAQLGRVFAALRSAGLEDSTIVVYVSDHGLALGSHGLLGKQNLYEHSVRVPLLISGPGVPAGRVADDAVYSLDLYATLAELARISLPSGLESRTLLANDGKTPAPGRPSICAMYKDCQRMVNDGRWKLIRYRVGGRDRLQLFDLENDPGEMHDLAADPAQHDTVERLLGLLGEWQASIGDRWMRESAGTPFKI
jgi:arylsulfatase A-like enzyme